MIMNSYAWDIYGMLCKNFENMIEILMHIYIYPSYGKTQVRYTYYEWNVVLGYSWDDYCWI